MSRTKHLVFASLLALATAPLAYAEPDSSPPPDEGESTIEAALSTVPAAGGLGASCTVAGPGLQTCGPNGNDNCCAVAPISKGVKLEKYQVTAGRMKAFLTATNDDVKSWYLTAKAKGKRSKGAIAQVDPFVEYLPTSLKTGPYGVYQQLGGTIYLPHIPSDIQGCRVGNANDQAWGSHTYPIPHSFEGDTRAMTTKELLKRALNCIAYPLAAALCAWDGGRLQTKDEHNEAWGPKTYPWGETVPGGFDWYQGKWTFVSAKTGLPCPSCSWSHVDRAWNYEPFGSYLNNASWDEAVYIMEPGRKPDGIGPYGHYDLAGNVMELTGTFEGTTTTTDNQGKTVTQKNVRWTKNGSWEGHPIGYDEWSFPIMTKYGKTGLRCAHD